MEKTCDKEFVALDLETTGLDPRLDRIVEVGAVVFRGSEILGVHETLVDPGVRIHPRITAIHGITNKMVTGSPTPEKAVAELEKFIGNRPLVIQNAPFDLGFIEAVRKTNWETPLCNPVFDTCRLAPLLFPGLRSYSLGPLSRALGIALTREHRAVDDSMAAMSVFLKCVERIDPLGTINYPDLEKKFSLSALLEIERTSEDLLWPDDSGIIREACKDSRRISIVYRSGSNTTTRRVIVPTGLVRIGGNVMLEAWCFLRNENRVFRFDRILEVHTEK